MSFKRRIICWTPFLIDWTFGTWEVKKSCRHSGINTMPSATQSSTQSTPTTEKEWKNLRNHLTRCQFCSLPTVLPNKSLVDLFNIVMFCELGQLHTMKGIWSGRLCPSSQILDSCMKLLITIAILSCENYFSSSATMEQFKLVYLSVSLLQTSSMFAIKTGAYPSITP